jgi:hypothetical protein
MRLENLLREKVASAFGLAKESQPGPSIQLNGSDERLVSSSLDLHAIPALASDPRTGRSTS